MLDLDSGDCPGLPDGMTVHKITRSGTDVSVELHGPLERKGFGQIFGGFYWDPEGGEHTFDRWSSGTVFEAEAHEETGTYEIIYLPDYPWDTVELELSHTSVSVYDEPVQVALAAK